MSAFNIGTTHEYDGLGSDSYKKNKLELRDKSLELNSFRLQTCHIVMGGVDTGIDRKAKAGSNLRRLQK